MTKTWMKLVCVTVLIGGVGAGVYTGTAAAGDSDPNLVATTTDTKARASTGTSTPVEGGTETGDVYTGLKISRLLVGTGVEEREPVGVADSFSTGTTSRVLAFVEIENAKAEATTVQLAWVDLATGSERGQYTLKIGAAKRWRTWARGAAPKTAGEFAVVVRDESGLELARTPFTMTE